MRYQVTGEWRGRAVQAEWVDGVLSSADQEFLDAARAAEAELRDIYGPSALEGGWHPGPDLPVPVSLEDPVGAVYLMVWAGLEAYELAGDPLPVPERMANVDPNVEY